MATLAPTRGRLSPNGKLTLALCGIVIAAVIGRWGAHWFIEGVYRGAWLPGLLENRDSNTLEHYYAVVDRLVAAGALLLVLVFAVLDSLRRRSVAVILALLLVGDVIFCTLSELYGGLLDVRLDRGIPEWFQYFKAGGAAFLLLQTFRQTGRSVFAGWAAVYAFVLLDDSLKYHEAAGRALGRLPGLGPLADRVGVRVVDLGEMISLVPVAAAVALLIAVPYLREGLEGRRVVHRLGVLFVALVFAGGVMDLVDRMAMTAGSDSVRLLSLLEDGGEMFVMSATFTYAVALWRRYVPAQAAAQSEMGSR